MYRWAVVFFMVFNLGQLQAQKANYYRSRFVDAEYYVLYEDYKEALPLYLEIYSAYPNNKNISFRIGQCYLNMPDEKKMAISYLEDAAKNITDNYKAGYFSENKAPKETLLYLGMAYRIDNQIDKALNLFNEFKKKLTDADALFKKEVEFQITVCYNAKELMKNPIEIKETNLGEIINTSFPNYRPAVSLNDSVMVYTSQLRFYDGLFFTRKYNNTWLSPINITPNLGSDGTMLSSSLSSDGRLLFLTQYDWDNYNIYTSKYTSVGWSKAEKFDRKINTRFNETHACITKDGKTIYFTSDRDGGYGGKDIYYITKDTAGIWSEPVNLGPTINTDRNEETPFITEYGTLFFSSQGHYNMGGYDIFYSRRTGSQWSKPVNIGYPLNTTDDNLFFVPVFNGQAGYIPLFRNDGYGESDIYRIEFKE